MDACVEGNGGSTRNGEQRTDGESADNRNCAGVERMHGHRHRVGVVTAFHRHRQHAHERKADAAQAEAKHAQRKVFACQLTEYRRKNQVAGAEEKRKQHQADGQD